LGDFVGDIQFAAGVASKWLVLDEPFIELARLQIRDIRHSRKQVHQALVKAGLDTVVRRYNNGEMPLVSLVEFGEEETGGGKKDKNTYEMIRSDSGEIIGIVVTDSRGQITLFVLYPDSGDTVVVATEYKPSGQVKSQIATVYDDDGNVVEQVDMLATEGTESTEKVNVNNFSTSFSSESSVAQTGGMEMMSMSVPIWAIVIRSPLRKAIHRRLLTTSTINTPKSTKNTAPQFQYDCRIYI